MKISKLFHWLYAILMLLPFLVFLPNAFYYGFNEHAVSQEKTEQVPIYYESNEVNTIDDLIIGNIYEYNDNVTTTQNLFPYAFRVCNILNLDNLRVFGIPQNANNLGFGVRTDGSIYLTYINDSNNQVYRDVLNDSFYFVIESIQSTYTIGMNYFIQHIGIYSNNIPTGDTQPLTTSMSITDSMSYAWDSVWQNDLFSWSYGSFLTEPFIYIGNVFNVPVDNSLYYALSYWLDISIIWLCFDVIMYVPLLVHRWLDKGIIE